MNFLNFAQDFFKLRQFYFVAKAGSLTEAAKMLNVSHAALSVSMKVLEHRLKTKLLVRTAKGMKLTTDGERLFEHTLKNFQDNEDFLRSFLDKSDEVRGEIKIMTTPSMGETNITRFLLSFLQKYPDVRIKMKTSIENVDVNSADVAIRTFIPHQLDLEQRILQTLHLKLWASPEYLKIHGTPQTPEDLDHHKLLAFEENKHNTYSNTNWILHVGRDSKPAREPYYQITSIEGLHHAATMGYGIVHLPQEYIKLKGNQLIEILPSLEGPVVEIYFIYPKRLAKSKRILALYDHLFSRFQELAARPDHTLIPNCA